MQLGSSPTPARSRHSNKTLEYSRQLHAPLLHRAPLHNAALPQMPWKSQRVPARAAATVAPPPCRGASGSRRHGVSALSSGVLCRLTSPAAALSSRMRSKEAAQRGRRAPPSMAHASSEEPSPSESSLQYGSTPSAAHLYRQRHARDAKHCSHDDDEQGAGLEVAVDPQDL